MKKLNNQRWYYILFEWPDWSWKTTQSYIIKEKINAILLSSHLNKNLKQIRNQIENLSENNPDLRFSYFLFSSIYDSEIAKTNLEKWKNVVIDRNIFSTLAYQRALWSKIAKKTKLKNIKILKPDLTIYLDVKNKKQIKRLKNKEKSDDKYLEENTLFLKQVKKEYKKFKKHMVYIDTTNKSIEKVTNEILNHIYKIVQKTIRKNSKK